MLYVVETVITVSETVDADSEKEARQLAKKLIAIAIGGKHCHTEYGVVEMKVKKLDI